MVKDRLAELRAKQQGKTVEDGDDTDGLNSKDGDTNPLLTKEHWNSIEGFLSRITAVNNDLERLEGYMSRMKELQGRILSQPESDRELSEQLSELDTNFRHECKEVRQKVKVLDEEAAEEAKPTLTSEEKSAHSVDSRIKRNQMMTVRKRLCQVAMKYNTEQNDYKERRKKNITQYLRIQGLEVNDESVMDVVENGNIDQLTKGLVLAVADKKALFAEVKTRKDELLHLEASLRELHEMFHDLHLMVLSQGEMIDNIESNVQSAVEYADRAKSNVIGARQAQKRARKMKICICIALVIAAILLFFLLQGLVCHFTPIC